MASKFFLVEGKDEIFLLLGILGKTDAEAVRKFKRRARRESDCREGCYQLSNEVILRDCQGKDNIKNIIKTLRSKKRIQRDLMIYVLVDGDARAKKVVGADKKISLEHSNLDELIFDVVKDEALARVRGGEEASIFERLAEVISSSGDSKEKELLAGAHGKAIPSKRQKMGG